MENTLEGDRESGEAQAALTAAVFISRMAQQGSRVKPQGGGTGWGIQVFKAMLQHKDKEHPG